MLTGAILWLFTQLQVAFLGAAAVFAAFWLVPPIRATLQGYSAFKDPPTVWFPVLALSSALLWRLGAELKDDISGLRAQITEGLSEVLLLDGSPQVARDVTTHADLLNEGKAKQRKTLTVLGLTLVAAWPLLEAWLRRGHARDWEIDIYCLSPKFVATQQGLLNQQWGAEADAKLDAIRQFRETFADDMIQRKIELRVHEYGNVPVMHGFRFGDGRLYLSTLQWTEKGQLDSPIQFYEVFAAHDNSLRAAQYRGLFENWLKRARVTSRQPFGLAPHALPVGDS